MNSTILVRLLGCVLLAAASPPVLSQDQNWLPVTAQDLAFTAPPTVAGASAVQLYYANYIYFDDNTEFFYHRIKLLSEAGREYADVTIELPPKVKLDTLQARTIRSDGTIVPFREVPFEKTILKGRGIKYLAQSFTFPEAGAGSIVEYKYKLRNYHYRPEWIIEHNLFTVRESFRLKYKDRFDLSPVVSPGLTRKPTTNPGSVELDLENVPAFQAEPQMPPEANYKLSVLFVPSFKGFSSTDLFWSYYLNSVSRGFAEFIEHEHTHVTKAVDALLAPVANASAEQRLRVLYDRAQEVRNLTYERDRSQEELKRESLKENKSVDDVLRRGFGTRDDINALFVAMARAAHFRAGMVLVSNRSERFFRKDLLLARQLDSSMVDVVLDGKSRYFDPGTKFCPFGSVRWMRTSTDAVKLGWGGGMFFTTPPAQQNEAVINRDAHMTVAEDGSLHGNLFAIFLGGEALERRLSALETDDSGRTKAMEEEVKSWLPPNAEVKLVDVQGWEQENEPLRANFQIDIPNYASLAGKRLLLPTCLFPLRQKDAFTHAERKYPVYFPYAFSEIDKVSYKLPQGYALEVAEEKKEARLSFAGYRKTTRLDGDEIKSERIFQFNAIFVDPKSYGELREFFGKVKAGDESQQILRQSDQRTER